MRITLTRVLLLGCLLLVGCAGDTYAPVSDRAAGGGAGRGGSHEVVRGDSLYKIAFSYGLDYRDVAAWNNISSPYTIYPGQRLRLSPAGGGQTASRGASPPPASQPRQSRPTGAGTQAGSAAGSAGRSSPPPASVNSRIDWAWPVSGKVLKTFSADGDGKQGINLGGAEGDEIKAAAAGRVVYSGSGLTGYGNLIIIKHDSNYLTAYGYNRELLLEEGASVGKGETIARMGRNGNTPMLHFELRSDGRAVDPLAYLPRKP